MDPLTEVCSTSVEQSANERETVRPDAEGHFVELKQHDEL